MGLFNRGSVTSSRITLEQGIMLAGLIIVGLFGISMLLGDWLNFTFPAGYIPLLMAVMLTVTAMFAVTKKMTAGEIISTRDIVPLLIICGITVAALIYLPGLIPPAFEQSVLALKGALPLP